MIKKIISILLVCLMILPTAVLPVFAEESETVNTYNLSELDKSVVLQPGNFITWEENDSTQYLAVTYTSKVPFNPAETQSSLDLIVSGGVIKGSLFESPDDNLAFAGWKVEEVKIKSSGTSEIVLSAVWDGDGGDKFVFYLLSFLKPIVRDLLSGLLDFIVEIATIFQ